MVFHIDALRLLQQGRQSNDQVRPQSQQTAVPFSRPLQQSGYQMSFLGRSLGFLMGMFSRQSQFQRQSNGKSPVSLQGNSQQRAGNGGSQLTLKESRGVVKIPAFISRLRQGKQGKVKRANVGFNHETLKEPSNQRELTFPEQKLRKRMKQLRKILQPNRQGNQPSPVRRQGRFSAMQSPRQNASGQGQLSELPMQLPKALRKRFVLRRVKEKLEQQQQPRQQSGMSKQQRIQRALTQVVHTRQPQMAQPKTPVTHSPIDASHATTSQSVETSQAEVLSTPAVAEQDGKEAQPQRSDVTVVEQGQAQAGDSVLEQSATDKAVVDPGAQEQKQQEKDLPSDRVERQREENQGQQDDDQQEEHHQDEDQQDDQEEGDTGQDAQGTANPFHATHETLQFTDKGMMLGMGLSRYIPPEDQEDVSPGGGAKAYVGNMVLNWIRGEEMIFNANYGDAGFVVETGITIGLDEMYMAFSMETPMLNGVPMDESREYALNGATACWNGQTLHVRTAHFDVAIGRVKDMWLYPEGHPLAGKYTESYHLVTRIITDPEWVMTQGIEPQAGLLTPVAPVQAGQGSLVPYVTYDSPDIHLVREQLTWLQNRLGVEVPTLF